MPFSTEEQAKMTQTLLKQQQDQINERKGHQKQEAIQKAQAAASEAVADGETKVTLTRRQVPGHLVAIGKDPETNALGERRTNYGDPTRDLKYPPTK